MEFFNKIKTFVDGKKTYIIALLTGILGIVSAFYPIPEFVWAILTALGLGAVRDAIGKK